jgi:hypothetical protein
MSWRWVKAFPKIALVFVILVGSTLAFAFWWVLLRKPKNTAQFQRAPVEDLGPKIAEAEAKMGSLILVDNDLYDVESGHLIFRNWLKHGMPSKLFWEPASKTVMAQYPLAFVRYGLDGAEKGSLGEKHRFAIADDYKWFVFAKDKDIWLADVDWASMKLAERKVTSIGQFNDQFFAENIILGTEKTLIFRNLNQILRVDLKNGEVHPMKIPLQEIGKRRSPDSKSVVGLQNGQFYCYDVDADEAKEIQVGRGVINDYQWLGNDRCAAISAMKAVVLYDRPKHTLTEVCPLAAPCNRIGEPSPDRRFVFCVGRGHLVLVDLEKRTAVPITGGQGVSWVSHDTFAFSREIVDSTLRGTWLQTVGQGERRVSPEPFLVRKAGGFIMALPSGGMVVFATKQGLSKMKPDGTELVDLVKLARPPERVLGIQEWKGE